MGKEEVFGDLILLRAKIVIPSGHLFGFVET